jgi:hypothetical protein
MILLANILVSRIHQSAAYKKVYPNKGLSYRLGRLVDSRSMPRISNKPTLPHRTTLGMHGVAMPCNRYADRGTMRQPITKNGEQKGSGVLFIILVLGICTCRIQQRVADKLLEFKTFLNLRHE